MASIVNAGLGCAIVPSLAVSEHLAPDVRVIPISSLEVHRTIGICEGLLNLVATPLGKRSLQALERRERLIVVLGIERS